MKYQAELAQVQKLLPNAQNILIALPADADIDALASGLALYLSLEQVNKKVSIVTEGVIKVEHTHLFGVGQIQNQLPKLEGGDFILTIGGVATLDGKVPAVEKMDYYPTGNDLNLVFKVVPGQKFEPSHITPKFSSGGFELIFILGASSFQSLGSIYQNSSQVFSGVHIVNINNQQNIAPFGATNVIDTQASSLSEIVAQVLSTLGIPLEGDMATNIINGIFEATDNLSAGNISADTYEVVALALRNGGQKPLSNIAQPNFEAVVPSMPSQPQPAPSPYPVDLSKIFNAPVSPVQDNFIVPPVISSTRTYQSGTSYGIEQKVDAQPIAQEEMPVGEGVETVSPEADWLTPKIFKGGKSSLG